MNRILLTLGVAMVCLGCGASTEKPEEPAKPKKKDTPTNAAPKGASAAPALGTVAVVDPLLSVSAPLEATRAPANEVKAALLVGNTDPERPAGKTREVAPQTAPDDLAAAAPEAAAGATGETEPKGPREVSLPEPKSGRVNARTLNVRVSPSTDKRPITTFKRDRRIKVVATKGNWLKIELPGDISTWIMSKFVSIPEGRDMPVTGTVNANRVRLRSAGDLKAPILRELPRDLQVEVVDRSGDWFKIKAPAGTYAWIFGKYVKFEDGPVAVDPPIKDPVKGPVKDPVKDPIKDPVKDPSKDPTVVKDPPDEVKDPKVVTGVGVEQFAEAEAAYRQAKAQKNPDLVKIFLKYYEVARLADVPKMIATTCKARMDEIASRIPGAQRKRIDAEVKSRLEARLKAIDAAARAAKSEIPKVAPKYTAVGYLDKAPDVAGIPGTHKLTLSGVLLYYLRPASNDVDLGAYRGRKVGVIGRKRYVKGWGIQVIDVSEIRPYKRPPSTRAWVAPTDK